jgi:SAM-dependent methyltransferase
VRLHVIEPRRLAGHAIAALRRDTCNVPQPELDHLVVKQHPPARAGPHASSVTCLHPSHGLRMAHNRATTYGERQPTSHERRAGQPWDASYVDGPAPWDTGQPQPAIVRLAGEGAFAGAVLDAGCGTGENALHIASLGLHVVGVDVADTALSIAREKAAGRGIEADFLVGDAFHLDRLDRVFETVLDSGLFHSFDSDERRDYVASLASVTGRGGHLYVLCFSDVGPDTGPHPVSQEELRAAFTRSIGWIIARIEPDRCQTRFAAQGAPAWLARIERI